MFKTFLTTNLLDPTMAYVGMTGRPNSNYKGSGIYFKRALKLYGKQNFVRVDLGTFETEDEAHYWEGFYIKTMKTLFPDGYNLSPLGGCKGIGSSSQKGKSIPVERRVRISETLTGKPHTKEHNENVRKALTGGTTKQKGVPKSDAHKKAIKESWILRKIQYPMTDETKQKISNGQTRKFNLLQLQKMM